MFKLRIYPQIGSPTYKKGIKSLIEKDGTKKELVSQAYRTTLRAEVIRMKDNKVVYCNDVEAGKSDRRREGL